MLSKSFRLTITLDISKKGTQLPETVYLSKPLNSSHQERQYYVKYLNDENTLAILRQSHSATNIHNVDGVIKYILQLCKMLPISNARNINNLMAFIKYT